MEIEEIMGISTPQGNGIKISKDNSTYQLESFKDFEIDEVIYQGNDVSKVMSIFREYTNDLTFNLEKELH